MNPRVFNSPFTAGDFVDSVSSISRNVVAELFFQRTNGSVGGGPFWVWQSEKGEFKHIASGIRINTGGLGDGERNRLFKLRSYYSRWKAAVVQSNDLQNYRQEGHAEEFLYQQFDGCLAQAGAQTVGQAHILVTKSPCIGELDGRNASTNIGVIRGCYSKLNFLALKHRNIQFSVTFKEGYGHFQHQGDAAADYMMRNRLSDNIEYEFDPEGF